MTFTAPGRSEILNYDTTYFLPARLNHTKGYEQE